MAIPMTAGEKDIVSKGFLLTKCSPKRTRKNGWQERSNNQCPRAKLVRKTPPSHHSKNSQNQTIRNYRKLIKLHPRKKNILSNIRRW